MMKRVLPEILDSLTSICTSVLIVIPQEITSHADFFRLLIAGGKICRQYVIDALCEILI
jgi:hypothetical protein